MLIWRRRSSGKPLPTPFHMFIPPFLLSFVGFEGGRRRLIFWCDWLYRVLHTYIASHGGEIEREDKSKLRTFFEGRDVEEMYGLDKEEFEELMGAVKA